MAKYSGLREKLLSNRIVAPGDLHEAPQVSWDDLRLVHTAAYVRAIEEGTLSREIQRGIGFPWSPQMVERARRSVGATLAATRAALTDGCSANLAGGTHHAFADRGEGFCVFNDVAVATRAAQRDGTVRRIAVIDCDVHQGNGTANIFREDADVFTFSMHGAKNYPFRKETSDLDVALDDGTGDEPYLVQLAHCLDVVLNRHRPELVFYLAGADPYEGDRLGRLKLTIEGLRRRDDHVLGVCRAAGLPVVVAMSGGYAVNVDDIVTIHANTIRVAADRFIAHHAPSAGSAASALSAPSTPSTL
jgi:acetoin utilization deacetylase AcuC-like enzyme